MLRGGGKSAISSDLQLLLWYQKVSQAPKIKLGLTSLESFIAAPRPVIAAHTGERKVAPGVAYNKPQEPILPDEKNERNVLITSALPYVNNVPHLGNIIGSVLSADVFARYCRTRGYNTLLIGGTDEYGTATETKALEENITPRELCDKFHTIHKAVYDWFQIDFDLFGRTSTEEQTEISQEIFTQAYNNGFVEEQSSEQPFCEEHQGFLADRFVEGTCPKCGYEDARGDQCDKCGALLNAFELINPRCKIDGSSPVKRETTHLYLSLDKLQPEVEKFASRSQNIGNWSKNSKSIYNNWIKEGLRPRAITRDLKWGVPVPLKGFENKVFYVWFDACIGYVSITACYTKEWRQWWHNPEKVELHQFMGKDNVPFHTVVFPATQIATRDKWTMLQDISTTEYLQYEGGKFSKSRNLGVFGNNAQEIGVPPSVWRYYLLLARPETSDTQFSWADFVARNNGELLANLGNLVNRVVKFVNAKYNGVIPSYEPKAVNPLYEKLVDSVNKSLKEYITHMEQSSLRQGLETAMHVSALGNQFLQDNKMDNSLFENHPEKCGATIAIALNLIYLVSSLIYPFMPETANEIVEQLNAPLRTIPDKFTLPLLHGHNIGKAKYLFKRIDEAKIEEWRNKFGGGSGSA